MADNILLEVVTPEKQLMREEVSEVYAPGAEGEFGVLPGHTSLLSFLRPGEVRYVKGNKAFSLAVSGGISEVLDDKVSLVVDAAELPEDIDVERAQQARERAEERLSKHGENEEIDFQRAELALQRALIRMQVVGKKAS